MEITKIENGILETIPQIPFVVDQVGEAMKWLREELDEGSYYAAVKRAFNVAQYTASISEANFFKTHLIIASLLNNIPNVLENERFSKFDTASKAVEKTLAKIHISQDVIEERGCFKALLMHLVPLANEDQECVAILLYGILNDLEEVIEGMKKVDINTPITQKDYITIVGYAYVVTNLWNSNLNLLNSVNEILNKISILLNSLKY